MAVKARIEKTEKIHGQVTVGTVTFFLMSDRLAFDLGNKGKASFAFDDLLKEALQEVKGETAPQPRSTTARSKGSTWHESPKLKIKINKGFKGKITRYLTKGWETREMNMVAIALKLAEAKKDKVTIGPTAVFAVIKKFNAKAKEQGITAIVPCGKIGGGQSAYSLADVKRLTDFYLESHKAFSEGSRIRAFRNFKTRKAELKLVP